MADIVILAIVFLAGCCVGIAPWHWLAKKNEKLAREIHIMTFGKDPKGSSDADL